MSVGNLHPGLNLGDHHGKAHSGAEAVETAVKCVRKWGYEVKGVPENKAEIIVCDNNFHGRTLGIVGFSTDPAARTGFGPFAPGFRVVPFGDHAGTEAWQEVPGEYRTELRRLIVTQGDTEPASVEQQRLLGQQGAQSLQLVLQQAQALGDAQ